MSKYQCNRKKDGLTQRANNKHQKILLQQNFQIIRRLQVLQQKTNNFVHYFNKDNILKKIGNLEQKMQMLANQLEKKDYFYTRLLKEQENFRNYILSKLNRIEKEYQLTDKSSSIYNIGNLDGFKSKVFQEGKFLSKQFQKQLQSSQKYIKELKKDSRQGSSNKMIQKKYLQKSSIIFIDQNKQNQYIKKKHREKQNKQIKHQIPYQSRFDNNRMLKNKNNLSTENLKHIYKDKDYSISREKSKPDIIPKEQQQQNHNKSRSKFYQYRIYESKVQQQMQKKKKKIDWGVHNEMRKRFSRLNEMEPQKKYKKQQSCYKQ